MSRVSVGELVTQNETINRIRDRHWVMRSFLLSGEEMEGNKEMLRWRRFTTADTKYTRPAVGQNTVLNSPPGFTPLADFPRQGLLGGDPVNLSSSGKFSINGMGARYSEVIDDNLQVVSLRFGVPKYKGLITFFTSFYDNESALLAKYGRVGLSYYFGKVIGTLVSIPLLFLWLPILVGRAFQFYLGRQSTSFIDFKPTMALFWTRTQVIMNNIGATLGIIPRTIANTGHYGKDADNFSDLDTNDPGYKEYVQSMHKSYPKVFNPDTGILDIYEVYLGAARLEKMHLDKLREIQEKNGTHQSFYEAILNYIETTAWEPSPKATVPFTGYLNSYLNSVFGSIASIGKESDKVETEMGEAIKKVASGEDPNALGTWMQQQKDAESGQQGAQPSATGEADPSQAAAEQALQTGNIPPAPPPGQPPASIALPNTQPPGVKLASNLVAGPLIGGGGGMFSGAGSVTSTSANTGEVDSKGQSIAPANTGNLGGTVIENKAPAAPRVEMMTTVTSRDTVDEKGIVGTAWDMIKGWFIEGKEHAELEFRQGGAFLNLAVNYTGQGQASFSNSVKETTIQGYFNTASGTARDVRVSMADFNTGFGFMDAAMGMVRQVFGGAMDAVQMSGLMALGGNAFADFPKQWDNSTGTLPTANFTIELRHPYGNELSMYLNVYPTIAALLAGALPQSTGPKSYTSPNICECFCRGVCAIRLGMIDSLTISHATGNLGYTKDKRPLGFDISFSVVDLSSIVHIPVGNGYNPTSPLRRVMDDDNPFNDYMAILTGLHTRDMIDPTRKLSIRAAARWADYRQAFSPGNIASRLLDNDVVRVINKIAGPTYMTGSR